MSLGLFPFQLFLPLPFLNRTRQLLLKPRKVLLLLLVVPRPGEASLEGEGVVYPEVLPSDDSASSGLALTDAEVAVLVGEVAVHGLVAAKNIVEEAGEDSEIKSK